MPLSKCALEDLDFLVKEPLETKILIAKSKIRDAAAHASKNRLDLFVSFSGGKDSLVMSDLVLKSIGKVTHLNANSHIEFPGVQFIRSYCRERDIPFIIKDIDKTEAFPRVVKEYGYPLISKRMASAIERAQKDTKHNAGKIRTFKSLEARKTLRNLAKYHKTISERSPKISIACCFHFKKNLLRKIPGIQFLGVRASESFQRKMAWSKTSCFYPIGDKVFYMMPIAFFTAKDIGEYCVKHEIKLPIQYHLGWERTGCWACGCGAAITRPNTYQLLRIWYPRQWHGVMYKWGFMGACEAVFIPTGKEIKQDLIDSFRIERLKGLTDDRYKKEISALIEKAEKDERSYDLIKEE